jgi:hypothetical protein
MLGQGAGLATRVTWFAAGTARRLRPGIYRAGTGGFEWCIGGVSEL